MNSPTGSYDLLLKGGHVLDPSTGVDRVCDVALEGSTIVAVDDDIPSPVSQRSIDVSGAYVSPGFIDMHCHILPGATMLGIDPDQAGLPFGVTTSIDAGSAGTGAMEGAIRQASNFASRTYLFAHLSLLGLVGLTGRVNRQVGELVDFRYADPDGVVTLLRRHPDRLIGIKVRLSARNVGPLAAQALWMASRVARETSTRVMVHIGDSEMSIDEVLGQLSAGDIVTHCFTPRRNGILDSNGDVHPAVHDAIARGVLLDVGHGRESFSYSVAEAALAANVLPDTISTDLGSFSIDGPVHSLAFTMTKFLGLGMSLNQVVAAATSSPASAIGKAGATGTLRPGATADLAVFRVDKGEFDGVDTTGEHRVSRRGLTPVMTILGGQVVYSRMDPA